MKNKIVLTLLIGAAAAFGDVLTFAGDVCAPSTSGVGAAQACQEDVDNQFINQSYGDTASVDVSYLDVNLGLSLRVWNTGYNTLQRILWAAGSDASSAARITLTSLLPGRTITLNSFDFGAFNQTTLPTNITVTDLTTNAVYFSYVGNVGQGAVGPTSFNVNASSSTGLVINWFNSAYNVGIDNVDFTVTARPPSAVPEPGSVSMVLAGLGGLIAFQIRRNRK